MNAMRFPDRLIHISHNAAAACALTLLSCLGLANTTAAQEYRVGASDSNTPSPVVIARSGFPQLSPRETSSSDDVSNDSVYRRSESTTAKANDSDQQGSTLPAASASRSKMIAPLVTVGSSLAIVLALFCGLVWVSRRFGGGAAASKPLPATALSPLGHIMLDPRTKLLLVKCGRKILVLSQTASGVTPLTEVSDPDEVRELVANCSAEAREVFEKTLRQIQREPAAGFTEPAPPRQLFASA